jgi:hypothetical protein
MLEPHPRGRRGKAPIDLTGRRFGMLVATSGFRRGRRIVWKCRCDCGNDHEVIASNLTRGHVASCGCATNRRRSGGLIEVRFMSGADGERRLYRSWDAMLGRCNDPAMPSYKRYGARGVTVCQRWAESFYSFAADMGERPPGTTLDRIDNAKGYEPGNCRWATHKEQQRNRSNNLVVTYRGSTGPLAQICEQFGGRYSRVYQRLRKGLSIEAAMA